MASRLAASVLLSVFGDNKAAKVAVDEVKTWSAEIDALRPTLHIGTDVKNVAEAEAEIKALLDQIRDMQASATIGIDNEDTVAKIEEIRILLEQLSTIVSDPEITVRDLAESIAEVQAFKAELDSLNGNVATADIKVDGGAQAAAEIAAVKAAADGAVPALGAVATAAANAGDKAKTAGAGAWYLQSMVIAGTGAFGLFGGKVKLFGGALDSILPGFLRTASFIHILIDGIVEFGAVAIPALIAFGAFASAAGQGVLAIYTRMAAMENVTGALGVKVGILNEGFLKLQNAVQPGVFELFGDTLDIINSKTGVFQKLVLGTETVVEDLAARMTNAITASGGLGSILATHAIPDLEQLGTVIGNVFGIFGNLLKAMPGVAEILLHVIMDLTGAFEALTANGVVQKILEIGLAIHGLMLWGGLAVTGITRLGQSLAGTYAPILKGIQGLKAWGAAALEGSEETGVLAKSLVLLDAVDPMVWAGVLLASLIALDYEFTRVSGSAKNFVATMNAQLANDNASQAIVQINTDIGNLNTKLKETSTSFELGHMDEVSKVAGQFGVSISDLAKGFGHLSDGVSADKQIWDGVSSLWNANGAAAHQAATDTDFYRGAIINLTGEQKNLITVLGGLMKSTTTTSANSSKSADVLVHSYHDVGEATKTTTTSAYGYAQALEIMNLAGIKSSDSIGTMETKIKGLITGYKAMGVSAGIAGNAVNAETFAADQASSGISKLQQSMSTFLSTVTGGESTFLTFVTGIAPATSGLNKVSVAATTGKASMDGLNAASLNLRQNFTEAITSAEGVYQALQLQTQASGGTAAATKELGNAGKDLVGTLLNQSKGSAAAQAQLFALAQTAGYTGTDSFAALSKWVGNTKDSEKDLNKETGLLTVSSANLAKDVTNLAGALGTTLTNAMATAVFQAEGGQGAFNKFADAIKGVDGQSGKLTPDAKALADELLSVMGNSKEAENEFITLSGKMGMSQTAATNLWNSVTQLGSGMSGTHGDRTQFNNDVQQIIDRSPGASHDVNELTSAIQKHGTTSSQYHGARQQLIGDLERAGMNAQTASRLVDGLTKSVQRLPKNTNVNVTEHATGTFSVSQGGIYPTPSGGSPTKLGEAARGWKIPGYGGGDSVHILAEPGEAIVPKHLVSQIAPLMKQHGVPGFASGGLIMDDATSSLNLGPWTTSEYQKSVNIMTKDLEKSLTGYQASLSNGMYTGKYGAGVSQWGNDVMKALKMLGLAPGLAFAVLYQMQTESGGAPNAINLSDSNAAAGDPSRGLMQVIQSTFDAYAGPFSGDSIYNPMANIYAAINYAMHRYGRTLMSGGMGIGSGHGYAEGGVINEPIFGLGLHSGQSYSFGEKGREIVSPVGRVHGGQPTQIHNYNISVNGDSDPDGAARRIHQSLRDYKRRKGGQPLGIA